MSEGNYTKYFLEINSVRMYIEEPVFEWDFFPGPPQLMTDGHAFTPQAHVLKGPVRFDPTTNPLINPVHKVLKANYDEIDAAARMKIKKHPKQIKLPLCAIGVEKKRKGVVSRSIKYKLFQIQALKMYEKRPHSEFYLLGFLHYTEFDSEMKVVISG